MAKCICCGGSCLTRGRIKLVDADICFKCFDALGFDHKTDFYVARDLYKWDEIKNGRVAFWEHKNAKHEQWLEEHPDTVEFMKVLDEFSDEEPLSETTSTAEDDDSEE